MSLRPVPFDRIWPTEDASHTALPKVSGPLEEWPGNGRGEEREGREGKIEKRLEEKGGDALERFLLIINYRIESDLYQFNASSGMEGRTEY